jgi:hypothetical protein
VRFDASTAAVFPGFARSRVGVMAGQEAPDYSDGSGSLHSSFGLTPK